MSYPRCHICSETHPPHSACHKPYVPENNQPKSSCCGWAAHAGFPMDQSKCGEKYGCNGENPCHHGANLPEHSAPAERKEERSGACQDMQHKTCALGLCKCACHAPAERKEETYDEQIAEVKKAKGEKCPHGCPWPHQPEHWHYKNPNRACDRNCPTTKHPAPRPTESWEELDLEIRRVIAKVVKSESDRTKLYKQLRWLSEFHRTELEKARKEAKINHLLVGDLNGHIDIDASIEKAIAAERKCIREKIEKMNQVGTELPQKVWKDDVLSLLNE